MPIHDWTRVDPGVRHCFQFAWTTHLMGALNTGLLLPEYYVTTEKPVKGRRRTLAVKHTSGHRIVALIEILSLNNKRDKDAVAKFVGKVELAIRSGVHLTVVDLFPAGLRDSEGMHSEIVQAFECEPYELPKEDRLTFVSYKAGSPLMAYLEHPALGDTLPDMPLFLTPEYYVTLPLERTYSTAYQGMPSFWREVIEGKREAPGNG